MKNRAARIKKTANYRTAKPDEALAIFCFWIVLICVFSVDSLEVDASTAGLWLAVGIGVGCTVHRYLKKKKAELEKLEEAWKELTKYGGLKLESSKEALKRFLRNKDAEWILPGLVLVVFFVLLFLVVGGICASIGYLLWCILCLVFGNLYLFAGLVVCGLARLTRRWWQQGGGGPGKSIFLPAVPDFAVSLQNQAIELVGFSAASIGRETAIIFALFIFLCGLLGRILNRKNFIVTRRSVERRYLGVITSFVFYGVAFNEPRGSICGLLLVVRAACESAIGLGLMLVLYRFGGTISIADYTGLAR